MTDPKRYNYRVFWSDEDQEFVGMCAEFPGMSWLEEDQQQAFDGIVALVGECIADLEAHNEPVPRRQLTCT
ncbi:MAG: antitoxin HicB [Thermosynechococcaceae cyanobacterium]